MVTYLPLHRRLENIAAALSKHTEEGEKLLREFERRSAGIGLTPRGRRQHRRPHRRQRQYPGCGEGFGRTPEARMTYHLTHADAALRRMFDLSRLLMDRAREARQAEPHRLGAMCEILQRHRGALDALPIHRVKP
jgi:hypothetical protein